MTMPQTHVDYIRALFLFIFINGFPFTRSTIGADLSAWDDLTTTTALMGKLFVNVFNEISIFDKS